MQKFKLPFLVLAGVCMHIHTAQALDIQYTSVRGISGSNILLQTYGIEAKKNFLCSTTSQVCNLTKKQTLGTKKPLVLKKALKQELAEKHAGRITLAPSKKILAYYKGSTDEKPNRSYVLKDLQTGAEASISNTVAYWDLVDDEAKIFAFSPNSKTLVYLDDVDGALALYRTDTTTRADTLASTKIPTSAYQIDDFLFADNTTIYYVGNTKENPYIWKLYRYDLKTSKEKVIAVNVSYSDELMLIGKRIVFGTLQAKGYGKALYNMNTGKIEQFKIPGINTKATLALKDQEVLTTDTVRGVLMTPLGDDVSKTYPLVIWMHGGPYRQASYGYHQFHSYGGYDAILDTLQKNNVIVLKLDYRGSFGSGRAFAEGVKGSVGTGDVTDVMNAIAYAKNRYHIGNVYLAGNSYGGYLALRTVVEHPDTFAGILSINGVTDWESLLVKMKTSIFNTQFNGLPNATNRNLYDQASIINRIGNLGSQKIVIVQGQADHTIPPWQADLIYEKLKAQNKNTSIVKYAGEDHVFREKKNIGDLCMQMFSLVEIPVDKECLK